MRRAALIAALSVGSLFNLFDLDQDAAMVQASEATDTDDDIIREELARRHEFDKQYRKAIARLLVRPGIREGQGLSPLAEREIHRITARVTREAMYRFAFDRRHPRIYPTPEARRRAYAALKPQNWPPGSRLAGS